VLIDAERAAEQGQHAPVRGLVAAQHDGLELLPVGGQDGEVYGERGDV